MERTPAPAPLASPPPERPSARAALGFFAILLALVVVDALAAAASPVVGLVWSELFTMLLPALVAAEGSNLRAARYLGFQRPRVLPVVLGALVGFAAYGPVAVLAGLWVELLPHRLVEELPDVARIFQGSLPVKIAVTAAAVGVAPICEEAAFRGYLQATLARAAGPAAAIGIGSLLFAARHLDPIRFAPLVLLGALFGWLAWRGGTIWPAIAAHAANNAAASAVALAAPGGAREASAGPAPGASLVILLGGAAISVALALAYLRATPHPPPPDASIALRDPADPSTRFRLDRVPIHLIRAGLLGLATLAALGLGAALWKLAGGT